MDRVTRETIQKELSKHLQEGETLLHFGFGSYGLKSCFVGLTDRRLLINERTIKLEDKSLEAIPVEQIAEVKVARGPLFPLDQFLIGLFMRRDLRLKLHDGKKIVLSFTRMLGMKENRDIPYAMMQELQTRFPHPTPQA